MKWDSPFDRVVSSLDLEDGSGIGEKSSIYKVNLANCPLVQDQNEKRLWSQQEALLDEESVGSRFFF